MKWPFKSRPKEQTPDKLLLRTLIDDAELCSVSSSELPVERLPVAELSAGSRLHFLDSAGAARSFDLSSAFDEGGRFLHLSVRVSPKFVVQSDGVVTKSRDEDPRGAFDRGEKGLRFQPFMLPEFSGTGDDLAGKGLFYRGLHFPGTITPGNVSAMCICDYCGKSFRLQSFHAGFADLVYFYCSDAPHTLVASSYLEDAPPVLGEADADALERFESRLPRCERGQCNGAFRYLNPLRCPHCLRPYIDFEKYPKEREKEYYGNHLYGDSLQGF